MGNTRSKHKQLYDYSKCKPGCKLKVDNEKKDPLFRYAIRQSPIWNSALLIQVSINDVTSVFACSLPKEVIRYIRDMYIDYSVQERIEKACTLTKYPWKLVTIQHIEKGDLYSLTPPDECVYKRKASRYTYIKNRGKVYRIRNYFWLDDVYYTDICKCKAYHNEMKRQQHIQMEKTLNITMRRTMGSTH
jgi:hypothetical protein